MMGAGNNQNDSISTNNETDAKQESSLVDQKDEILAKKDEKNESTSFDDNSLSFEKKSNVESKKSKVDASYNSSEFEDIAQNKSKKDLSAEHDKKNHVLSSDLDYDLEDNKKKNETKTELTYSSSESEGDYNTKPNKKLRKDNNGGNGGNVDDLKINMKEESEIKKCETNSHNKEFVKSADNKSKGDSINNDSVPGKDSTSRDPKAYNSSPPTSVLSDLSDMESIKDVVGNLPNDGLSSSIASPEHPPAKELTSKVDDGLSVTSSDYQDDVDETNHQESQQTPLKTSSTLPKDESNEAKVKNKVGIKNLQASSRSSVRLKNKRLSLSPEKNRVMFYPKRKKSETLQRIKPNFPDDDLDKRTLINRTQNDFNSSSSDVKGLKFSTTCICCQQNRKFLLASVSEPMINSIIPSPATAPMIKKGLNEKQTPNSTLIKQESPNLINKHLLPKRKASKSKDESRRGSRSKGIYTANWSPDEDEAFKEAFLRNGNNWKQTVIEHGENGTLDDRLRDRSSISLGQKFFSIKQCLRKGEAPVNHGTLVKLWTEEELRGLIDGMAQHGQNWKGIIQDDRKNKGPLGKKDEFDICIKAYSEYDRRSKLKEFLGVFEGLGHPEF
ncbi:hypothetical protein K502DRAFT_326446 [Neoconidiobolus thromboides FSU 785]|nr:hypothetical protein K502DRAFT_326446 [Neoconidiobolus thromboides FSU 785]